MKKILSVFGTRPEATKMVPLVLALEAEPELKSYLCVTAQHRELLDQVLNPMGIKPDYDLNIMTHGQSLADVTTRVLAGLSPIMADVKPDMLLVHGDTITTFAASLVAFFAKIPVGHVEAGLRTYDKFRPYPEEVNRKLVSAVADLFFAPTEQARENLLKENILEKAITVTGNTAIDFLKYAVKDNYNFEREELNRLDFSKRIVLITAHRNENLGRPMEAICQATLRLIENFPDTQVVWALHPNKAASGPARRILSNHSRILLTEALCPFDIINLMKRTYLLLTDSGGLQEEAPTFDLPTVVMREVTERPEGLNAGTMVLAGVEEESIYNHAVKLLTNEDVYNKMARAKNPFGDGHASGRIVQAILSFFA
ncbi:MAG: UDP-N-acetylglucosamine 2-epimerase (non-hydrolyzing) [Defluviitaleaceae bacterium]|nr:UDP-N-acetylglucosamine 2-epimerase (non-hydrolyzing) [Defluviitaleaceae bacterium]